MGNNRSGTECTVPDLDLGLLNSLSCIDSDIEKESPGLIYDLGLNKGQSMRHFLEQGHSVVAVEADPGLVSSFEGRIRRLAHDLRQIPAGGDALSVAFLTAYKRRVTVVHRAIGAATGTSIRFCRADVGGHVLDGNSRGWCYQGVAVVNTTTCAQLLAEHGRARRWKLDVEGQEMNCLRSLLTAPHWLLPHEIVYESPMWTTPSQEQFEDFKLLVSELEQANYRRWKRQNWALQDGHMWRGDEVIDGPSGTREWVSSADVSRNGCGLLRGKEASKVLPPFAKRNNACDFHVSRIGIRERGLLGPSA